uniref:Uncharacterized protein n=1 Tax=Arundo donax TaxID=35708 RepID=A0A0A9HBA2_ARUDO
MPASVNSSFHRALVNTGSLSLTIEHGSLWRRTIWWKNTSATDSAVYG